MLDMVLKVKAALLQKKLGIKYEILQFKFFNMFYDHFNRMQ